MRDLETGARLASAGVLALTSGANQWTGVVIDINSTPFIVTTTSNLGSSPTVQYLTSAGVRGNAWVSGRDDDHNIAVFQAVDPTQPLSVVDTTGDISVPFTGKQLATLQYINGVSRPADTNVVGSRQSPVTELLYFQIQTHQEGSEGGAVVDEYGRLRGMRIESEHAQEILAAFPGESYALAAVDLIRRAPLLLGLPLSINDNQCAQGSSFPPIPSIFRGSVSIGGQTPPDGSTLYAKVSRRGLPDLWFHAPISSTGRYQMTLGVCQASYNNQPVEFWLDGVPAAQTGTVRTGQTITHDVEFAGG